jgi:hypothetical protein
VHFHYLPHFNQTCNDDGNQYRKREATPPSPKFVNFFKFQNIALSSLPLHARIPATISSGMVGGLFLGEAFHLNFLLFLRKLLCYRAGHKKFIIKI